MSWELDGRSIRSVLVTRLRYLGDIVMSTVLVEALRRGDPDLDIGYLCEDGFAAVLQGHPGIDRLHRLRTVRTGGDARARIREDAAGESHGTLGMVREIRGKKYDLAVDLFFNPRSAWLLKLAGIPLRIGGTDKPRGRLYTHRALRGDLVGEYPRFGAVAPGGLGDHLCRLGPLKHRETGLDFPAWLLATFGPGEMKPDLGSGQDSSLGLKALTGLGLGPREPFLLLAPCATWESKQWPAARWEELVSILLEGTDLPLLVMVAPGKEDDWGGLVRLIPRGRGGVLPSLPLAEALAVTAAAQALVTVDGGLMHAAVGLDVPTLAIFGPTDPAVWFPYEESGPFRVLARAPHCHPCNRHECSAFICLPELDAAAVWRSLSPLLEGSATGKERT